MGGSIYMLFYIFTKLIKQGFLNYYVGGKIYNVGQERSSLCYHRAYNNFAMDV